MIKQNVADASDGRFQKALIDARQEFERALGDVKVLERDFKTRLELIE